MPDYPLYYADTGSRLQTINEVFSSYDYIQLPADEYVNSLYNAIVNVLHDCSAKFYTKVFCHNNESFCWSPNLTNLKRKSRDALNNWRMHGCPLNGVYKEILVKSKREYKTAVKDAKRAKKLHKVERLMHDAHKNGSKGFWNTWNKQFSNRLTLPNIEPNLFANAFKNNFIDSKSNVDAVYEFNQKHNELLMSTDDFALEFDVSKIEIAVHMLNLSEALDYMDLNIFHIIYAHPAVFVSLKMLFNSMLLHGIVPKGFGQSVITPVIKCKNKSFADVNNYRPVSIIPICSKIFESCVSCMFSDKFDNHRNQFRFVKEGGCSKALFAFNSIVKYFKSKGSNVFCCSLDATKAFDRLNHFLLTFMFD